MSNPVTPPSSRLRVRIFVDFWNFALSLRGVDDTFRVDWLPVGPLLAAEAGKLVDRSTPAIFEGMHVYGSYDPAKPQDGKFRNWMANRLDKMPGTHVVLVERQKKKRLSQMPGLPERGEDVPGLRP